MDARQLLLWISRRYKGHWPSMYECIKNKVQPDITTDQLVDEAEKFKEKYITIVESDYPQILKECTDGTVPFVLYYRGDLSLLTSHNKKLAVIGSRKSSKYGESKTRSIVEGLPENTIIVSGLARGIDTIGIRAALDSNKKVIAVIGNSIDTVYPEENAALFKEIVDKGGIIVSEYPPETPISPDNFRWRNRIVAALSDTIMCGESYERSGCSITIGYGLNFGKTICCIPYPANINSFCNQLIKDGASLVETSDDVKNLLGN